MKGFEYIDKAIALDPNLASAYVTRAWLKFEKSGLFDLPLGDAESRNSKATCGWRWRSIRPTPLRTPV